MASPTSLLRLMRFGLAPTAAADAAVLYFLTHADPWTAPAAAGTGLPPIDWGELGLLALASMGLYGFGMVQNDLVDQARDSLGRRDRPLVNGEVSPAAGSALAVGCAAVGLGAAAGVGRYTLVAALVVFALINLYHLATKTLGGIGILNLGLVRFANALLFVADPQLTWPPFVLFAHITLMTASAYRLEGKSPPLGLRDVAVLAAGCGLVAAAAAAGKLGLQGSWTNAAWLSAEGAGFRPLSDAAVGLSTLAFAGFAWHIGRTMRRDDLPGPARGGLLIKHGLLYLFVLDASFLLWDRPVGALGALIAMGTSYGLMNILRKPPAVPPPAAE
jgi:hypothetical protein